MSFEQGRSHHRDGLLPTILPRLVYILQKFHPLQLKGLGKCSKCSNYSYCQWDWDYAWLAFKELVGQFLLGVHH